MLVQLTFTWRTFALALLVLHVLLCLAYAYDRMWNVASLQEALLAFVLCLFLPVLGVVMLWMRDVYVKRKEGVDYSNLFQGEDFTPQDLGLFRPLDQKEELNRAPVAEKLMLNSYELRRRTIMDTLSGEDTMEYLSVLRLAMENEDSETSHYASSIMMLLQSRMQSSLQQKQRAWEQNRDDPLASAAYEAELYSLLCSDLMDEQSLRRYHAEYDTLSNTLLNQGTPSEELLSHRVTLAFRQKDYASAALLIDRYLALYPASDEAVYQKLCLCIQTRDRHSYDSFCATLKSRPVTLTQRTLACMRFFAEPRAAQGGTT